MAVGNYIATGTSGRAAYPLIEHWNGLAWLIQRTPTRVTPNGGNLLAVSCTSASACTAVGLASSGGALVPLAERWNGRAWAVQPIPSPAGADYGVLNGVSCTSVSACTAVGTYQATGGDYRAFAERWNGTSWTVDSIPNPGDRDALASVSCTSASACTAAGDYDNLGTDLPLVERWDGTSWTVQSIPEPAGQRYVPLDGVSCASASACIAVGSFNSPDVAPNSLVERWDGTTWTIQPVPSPAHATGSQLLGVSCTSATVCTASGVAYNSFNTGNTLAVRYS
jgi:hypothetical protein